MWENWAPPWSVATTDFEILMGQGAKKTLERDAKIVNSATSYQ